jgi:hypothetical protein
LACLIEFRNERSNFVRQLFLNSRFDQRRGPINASAVRRSAAALIGATLVIGCTPVTSFDMLATSDRDLFTVCKPSLLDSVCKDGDIVAREDCLESRGAAYGQLHSPKMRRSWLLANGCPESTVDAPPATETATPTAVAMAAPQTSEPPPPRPPAPGAAAPPVRSDPAPRALVKADPPAPLPQADPAPSREPDPSPPLAPTLASPPAPAAVPQVATPAPPPAARPAPPVPAPSAGAFSDRERAETRERRLRDIIVAHGREMKGCVERQLKLMPDLRADGTLVIEVDANGTVPRAELVGTDLAGTQLESCLRTIASRWRFPSSGRGYRIDAPVKVSGSGR